MDGLLAAFSFYKKSRLDMNPLLIAQLDVRILTLKEVVWRMTLKTSAHIMGLQMLWALIMIAMSSSN